MLAKPSRLARDVAKHERRQQRATATRNTERVARMAWAATCAVVWGRDRHRCRACGCEVMRAPKGHPAQWGHVHHLVYRSAGGTDGANNLVLLCATCHDREHRHLIDITGDGDGEIVVTRRDA